MWLDPAEVAVLWFIVIVVLLAALWGRRLP